MTRLYHNNELVFEREKVGRNGAKFALEVGQYVAQMCDKSDKDTVHTFVVRGDYVLQILCAFYNPDKAQWETKEMFARVG